MINRSKNDADWDQERKLTGYTEVWRGTKIGREGEKRRKRKGGSKTETLERLYICRERHTNTEEERYRERRGTKRSHEIPCSKKWEGLHR